MAATRMPTAGRMTAAVAFAALAAVVSLLAAPLLPEGLRAPYLPWWNAAIGAVCGYRIVGLHSGDGAVGAAARGLTAGVATAVVALMAHSAARMIDLALLRRVDGVLEGLASTFGIAAGYAAAVASPAVVGTALAGSIAAGLLADAMQRRFT